MKLEDYHKIVLDKDCRILYNRTTVRGFSVGDTFSFQTLKGPYKILFFFKDKIFDDSPMIFGLNETTGLYLLVSISLIKILEHHDNEIKRKRRI